MEILFKVTIDQKQNEHMSLMINGKSYVVNSFCIHNGLYIFRSFDIDIYTTNRDIRGTYINDDIIHILSLPINLLKKFGCMRS